MASRLEDLSLDGRIGATSTRHPVQLPDSIPIVRLEMEGDTWIEADAAMPRLLSLDMVTIIYELDKLRNLRAVEHASFEADSSKVDYGPFFDLLYEPVDPMWPNLRQLELWSFDSQSIERDGLLRLVKPRNGARDPDNDSHSPRAMEKIKFDMKVPLGTLGSVHDGCYDRHTMSTARSRAGRMRKRLFDDLDALDAVEHAVLDAKSARERAQAALELAQADYDLAAGEEQDLQERSAALRAGTIRLRNSLQTMASFPSDLLVMIVTEAAALQVEDRDGPTMDWDAALAPYYAIMVNQHWRRSVLSAARCWTYVVVPLVIPSETAMSMTGHLELALRRSRSLPIDVHLSIEWAGNAGAASGRDTDADRELYSNIFDLITGHTSRIRSLVNPEEDRRSSAVLNTRTRRS
ncbi:hypothetical protein EXIGLDRAFT_774713 [Exidia glandulosa HHB12029]|uniref:F-box domain-containing protein n=1 Tax=Exidia glandulosa HHB12029 TaxID=1314781 RepID=A0A165E8H7_EXIGL|nr:hypothetical protein EXIGLDRAFT_774713 [Exidia glandulosa HHB12029]